MPLSTPIPLLKTLNNGRGSSKKEKKGSTVLYSRY